MAGALRFVVLLSVVAPACTPVIQPCSSVPLNAPTSIALDHVLVEYRAGSSVGQTPAAEVHSTASYDQSLGTIHTVALRFPDDCLTEGAAIATGAANDSTDIMGTRCGVWLAELERALTDAHYKVISWSALRQAQDTKHISTYEAAVSLGAEVVLGVNSMETHTLKRGESAGATYQYFESNVRGDRLAKLALPESERAGLKKFVAQQSGGHKRAEEVIGVAATLDVTAVLAKSGESIWFFRHGVAHSSKSATGMRFLFERLGDGPLTPVSPQTAQVDIAVVDTTATEDVEESTVASSPENPYQAEEHDLARTVAKECVARFSGKAAQ